MDESIKYYKSVPVLIIGESGSGKSTSLRTLPPEETVILNTEEKAMPFRNHDQYKVVDINSYKKLDQALRYYASDKAGDKFKYIVLDSFTSMTEMVDRYANAVFSGFEQWKQYNLIIGDIIRRLKVLKQQVFILGIPEQKAESFGEIKKYLRVKGNELKYGNIEKEFTIVLFTSPIYDEDTGEMDDVELLYRPNRRNSAKAPDGMFSSRPKNDALFITQAINKYYEKERNQNEGDSNK